MSKNFCPILKRKHTIKIGQDFLDLQFISYDIYMIFFIKFKIAKFDIKRYVEFSFSSYLNYNNKILNLE